MTLYFYNAINGNGRRCKGVHESPGLPELEFALRRGGLYLIDASTARNPYPFYGRKIRRTHLIVFFISLEQLLNAGVPLLECLTDLRDSMDDARFRAVIASLAEGIEGGTRLSQAMAQHPEAFDEILLGMTRAGEESGRLPEVFRNIGESLKWQDEIAAQSRTLLIYPLFAGAAIVALTLFLMLYLVPQLTGFVNSMGLQLPPQTRLLLAVSAIFSNYWPFMLAFPLLLYATYKIMLPAFPALPQHLDAIKLRLPAFGPVLHKLILARFASTFAMMYASGIGVLDCLACARELVGNRAVARGLEDARQEIESGKSLTHGFQAAGVFPPLVIRMLKVGEASGKLDAAMHNVAYFYEREAKEALGRAQVMIEPALTVVAGLLLGWVAMAVLPPIYDVISRIAT